MAIKQTVSFTKVGTNFSGITDAIQAINITAVDSDPAQDIYARLANGEFTATASFDVNTQTLIIERVWIESYFNEYKSANAWMNTTSILESGGWAMSESIETI